MKVLLGSSPEHVCSPCLGAARGVHVRGTYVASQPPWACSLCVSITTGLPGHLLPRMSHLSDLRPAGLDMDRSSSTGGRTVSISVHHCIPRTSTELNNKYLKDGWMDRDGEKLSLELSKVVNFSLPSRYQDKETNYIAI